MGAWKLRIPPNDRPLDRRFEAETGGGRTMLSSLNGFANTELEGGGTVPDIKALASENGLNRLPKSKLRPGASLCPLGFPPALTGFWAPSFRTGAALLGWTGAASRN